MAQPEPARTELVPLAFVAVAALAQVYIGVPLFRGSLPVSSDLPIHFAEIAHLAGSIERGDLALWNPMFNLGFVSGYYYQLLPQLAVALPYLLLGKLVPLLVLFKISLVAPMVLLPMTCYRALRVAGLAAWPAAMAASSAAFLYSSSTWGHGFDSMFTTGIWTQHWAMVFLPLAMVYGVQWLGGGRCLVRALVYALLVGLCHPFIAIGLGLALPLAGWWRGHGGAVDGLVRAAALGGLALAASAFFWLPILVHYDSFGGFPKRHLAEHGMSAMQQLDLMAGGELLDHGRWPVLSIGFALALALAPMPRRLLGAPALHAALRVCVGAALLFAVLMAVGDAAGKVGDDLAPMMRLIAPMQLAMALAAGLAYAGFAAGVWREVTQRFGPVPSGSAWRLPIATAAALILTAALIPGARAAHDHRVVTSDDYPAMHSEELPAVSAFLAQAAPGRFLAAGIWDTGSAPWLYHLAVQSGHPGVIAWGGAALQSSPVFRYLNLRVPSGIDTAMAAVRYLIVSGNADKVNREDAREVFRAGEIAVLEVPSTGYFRPVRVIGSVPAQPRSERYRRLDAWMDSPGPTVGEYLVIGAAPPGVVRPADAPLPEARVLAEDEGPARYGADVVVDGAGPETFAISVGYFPGWRLTIDGVSAPLLRLSPEILGASVPAGPHRVVVELHRPRWPWLLLLASGAIIAGVGAWEARRRRGPRRSPAAAA